MKYDLGNGLVFDPPFVFSADKAVPLTKTQSDIFELLVISPNRPIPTKSIAIQLWGDAYYDMQGDPLGNIRMAVRNLRIVLGQIDDRKLVLTIRNHGYVYATDERLRALAS